MQHFERVLHLAFQIEKDRATITNSQAVHLKDVLDIADQIEAAIRPEDMAMMEVAYASAAFAGSKAERPRNVDLKEVMFRVNRLSLAGTQPSPSSLRMG